MGDSLHSAEPDNILTASDRCIKMWLCQAVTGAASDKAVNLVSLPAVFCHSAVCHERLHMSLPPRFFLENFYLDKHVRYIVAIYPVVILWLTGTQTNAASPRDDMYIFNGIVQHHTPVGTSHFYIKYLFTHWILWISSFFRFHPGSFSCPVCDTHCPGHMEALQTATL